MDKKTMQLWVEYVAEVQERNSQALVSYNQERRQRIEDFVEDHKKKIERKNRRNIALYEKNLKEWRGRGFFFKLFNPRPEAPRIENHQDHFIVTPPWLFQYNLPQLESVSLEGFMSWCAARYNITPPNKPKLK